jgi:hypothetical protein
LPISAESIADKRRYFRALKERTPCTDCGRCYPYYVMDFDHVKPGKSGEVGDMISTGVSWGEIIEEIALCELVCANCHRERTHQRGYPRATEPRERTKTIYRKPSSRPSRDDYRPKDKLYET